MNITTLSSRIKQPKGWVAAGDEFRRAARVLSDGAFKLFVHLALEADSRTGRVLATYKGLATELKKSKRAIGTYSAELAAKKVCDIRPGENQYCKTIFEICDSYWPYERDTQSQTSEVGSFVAEVKKLYLSLGCTKAKFGPSDVRKAQEFERQGVPLEAVKGAIFVGASRKYSSWLQGSASEPIGSLAYFESLVAEIQQKPFPQGYTEYLRVKATKLAEAWAEMNPSGSQPKQEKR